MANNPTILVSSLDDSQMRQSIANLVASVKIATHTMTTDFDSAVDHINTKLKELGGGKNVSAKSGGSANTTSTKQETQAVEENTAARKKNAQAAKEQAMTFDQMAQAQQQAVAPKSARDSYLAFVKGYKEQAQQIARQIQEAENALNSAVAKRLASLNQQIDNAKRKLNELYSMKTISESYDGSGLKTNTNRINSQIEQEMRKIAELQEKINRLSGDMVRPDLVQRIGNLYTEYSRISNIMKDDAVTSQQQLNTESKKTAEIEKQAKAIRESKDWNTKGSVLVNDRVYYNPEKVKGVKSLEEQILQTIKDQEIAEIRKASAAQSAAAAQQTEVQQSKAILDTETRITEEINKRKKKYSSPDMQVGYDVTRDKLAQIIAGKNNIQAKQVVNWDEQTSSIKTLSAALKQYQDTYAKMSAIERNSPFGKQIISDIQVLERNIQKVRREMSRPLNFSSAMAGSERTLDDIALKMQRLRAYRQSIDITKPNAANDIKQVDDALAKLQRDMDKYMSKSKQVNEINTALGRSWNYMKNRLAFYFTVGATTQFVKSLVDIRGQYELLERSIGILVDSAQNGSRIFAELNAMAIKSPFTTMELGAAAKQLVAYDVAAKDVVDTTKRLADMAAAVGVPIERLTYALGQIKSYSYLNARDARMFANTGIPLVKNLADMYTKLEGRLVSTSDVYDRIKKKAVSYNDVMRVVNEMTDEGGKFFNFQEKAADTLKVKIANLTLAYNNMLNEMGKSNQGFISGGLGALKTLMEHWRDVYNTILALVPAYGAAKIAQLLLFKAVNKTTMATAAQAVFSEKLVAKWQAVTVAAKGATAASIGVSLATAGVLALVAVLGKLAWDYYDLKKANEEFNKSVADGAEENIQSINKFFESYKKELTGISGANESDQQKMWERMQEEIEKTTRNAQEYLDILNDIDNTASRIKAGAAILSQQQVVEQEIKDLANRGVFDLGGGFADDSMAKDLKEFEDALKDYNDMLKATGREEKNLADARKEWTENSSSYGTFVGTIKRSLGEAEKEIDGFIAKLESANIDKIMGDGDERTRLANVRNFASRVRDAFLATEQGSKIGYEGQALLNRKLDEYISKLGRANKLFVDRAINGKTYNAEEIARIESNRTAWERFFERIKPAQKKLLDYAVSTGQTNSKQVREIWDYAAKEMAKTDKTAYDAIQEHIAALRNTPDIVLNVVYKEREEKSSDKIIEDYKEHFLKPKGESILAPDEYFNQVDELNRKYASFNKKEGEDRVEWAKRIHDTMEEEEKLRKSAVHTQQELVKELGETKAKEDERYKAAQKDAEDAKNRIAAAKEVWNYEKLYYEEKNKKGKQKDPILEALKLEVSLVEKLRADYEKLTKAGASQKDSLATIHKAYGKTIKQLNAELKSFGLPQLDIAKIITGKDPKKQLEHFRKTLDSLVKRGLLNVERSKVVEAVIEKLTVTAEEYDFTELSKGIEKELGKLKEKIELGAALDAEPQLGNLFAQMYGFNSKELPRTFSEIVEEAQYIINKAFHDRKKVSVDIEAILDKDAFEKWAKGSGKELDSTLVQSVQKVRDYLVETQRKMISDTSKEYDKLMERYSEYQFRLIKVDKDTAAERLSLIRKFAKDQHALYVRDAAEIANEIAVSTDPEERERLSKELSEIVKKVAEGNDAVIQIGIGIDRKEAEEKAQIAFDEFTKNPEWKTAIGDLEGMTHQALRTLIKDLEDFIKTNKKLTPKQINQVEKTISKLHKQIRKNNPFAALNDTIEEAENRSNEYKDMITKMSEELATLEIIPEQKRTKDQQEQIVKLTEAIKKYKKEIEEVGEIDMGTVFGDINSAISSISEITSSVTKLLDAIGGENATKASETISNIVGNMEAAGKGAQIGSSFGGYGAAIGAIAGGLTDLATRLADVFSGNKKITEKIIESEREVKKLTALYNKLEYAMKSAFGDGEMAAKGLLIANKKLQLAELETQLQLEESRKKKNRDEDKILDLQEQIEDAKRELTDMADEVTESFLNISSVKDAVSSMIDGIINALKNGENAMDSFTDSWEEMCWNMIKQVISTEILAPKFKKIFDEINDEVNKRGEKAADDIVKAKEDYANEKDYVKKWSDWYVKRDGEFKRAMNYYDLQKLYSEGWVDSSFEEWDAAQQKHIKDLEDAYTDATSWTLDDVERYAELLKSMQGDYEAAEEATREAAERLGLRMGDKGDTLSNLQQGIQGITEDTANALEAYMNGVSQQVYAHTELLTEIRDAVVAFNGDATLGVQSQMLLQLQNNYILMQTMQTLMENWTVPSGNGIRVELMN